MECPPLPAIASMSLQDLRYHIMFIVLSDKYVLNTKVLINIILSNLDAFLCVP